MAKSTSKKISPGAYDALVDALSAVFWNKAPFERFIRLELRDHPELVSKLSFDGLKRQVASDLVMELALEEAKYQEFTLRLMLEVAAMDDFSNLRRQKDNAELLAVAHAAVSQLRVWTEKYSAITEAQERMAATQRVEDERSEQRRSVANVLTELKESFLTMHVESNPQSRGRSFEVLLNELFILFDLKPRRSFTLVDEQIDGAFTFNTDDYLLEAKWENHAASREEVDVLSQKVQRKGKNTLGLFVAVSGFSDPAIRAHSNCGTGLVFMDGADLFSIFEGHISLTELLDAKRRHVNETGLPLLMVKDILA